MNIRFSTLLLLLVGLCMAGIEQASAFYNPSTGRWLSKDPIEEEGGNNLYCYCQNDGINHLDPTGLDFIDNNAYTMVESLPHKFGQTVAGITFHLQCNSACKLVIKQFDIKIIEIDIATHAVRAGTLMPRLPKAIQATETHERLHVQHYHDFYDSVAKQFPMDCGGKDCQSQIKPQEDRVNKEFNNLVARENQHIGPEWPPIQLPEQ